LGPGDCAPVFRPHWLALDSGAGIVAGMNLSYPNSPDVVFLLATDGIGQICWDG
jgi:hypothetical protein